MAVTKYDSNELTHQTSEDENLSSPGFARDLCLLSVTVVAGGASPSTVTIDDLAENTTLGSVQLSKDVRNAIHGLEVWPFT